MGRLALAWSVLLAGCSCRPLGLPEDAPPDLAVAADRAAADLAVADLAVTTSPDFGRSVDLLSPDLAGADLSPQCPELTWTRVYGDGLNVVVGTSAAGEVILGGGFNTHISFGGLQLTTYGGDNYLVALDGDGNPLWGKANHYATAFGPGGAMAGWTDRPDVDAGTPDGGAYHDWLGSWSSDGSVRWQAGTRLDYPLLAYRPDGDLWTASLGADGLEISRLDGNGAARWSEAFDADSSDPGVVLFPMQGAGADGVGRLLLAASLAAPGGLGDGDPIAEKTHQLLAYDGDGALSWKRVSNTELYTHAAAGPTGATAIAGVDSFKTIVLEQIDGNGVPLWKRTFPTSAGVTNTGLAVTSDGGVVWAGAAADVDFGGGTLTGSGMMVAAFDANGSYRWSRKLDLDATCGLYGPSQHQLAVDGEDHVYVAGCAVGSSVDFCGASYATDRGGVVLVKF